MGTVAPGYLFPVVAAGRRCRNFRPLVGSNFLRKDSLRGGCRNTSFISFRTTNQLSRSTLNTVVILSDPGPQRQVFVRRVKKRRTSLCSSLSLQPSLKNKVCHSERSEEPASKSSSGSSDAARAPIIFPNHVCHSERSEESALTLALPLHAITLPKRRIEESGPHAAPGEESP